MRIIRLIFGRNGADKADSAYEENCKAAEAVRAQSRALRREEEQALEGVGERRGSSA